MTVQELLNGAGRLIGELRADRSFGVTESAQLLQALNNMLGTWSASGEGIHQTTRELLTLTGAASYTVGPTGTLNTTRPVKILAAATVATTGATKDARIVNATEWAAAVWDEGETGTFADLVHADYGNPLITLRVSPKPASGSLALYSLKPLTAFAALGDTVTMPEGYADTLQYAFAVQIAPTFGTQASDTVVAVATAGRAAIAVANQGTPAA